MAWDDAISKYDIVAYINKRGAPRKAKQLLRDCLERIDALERANASFPNSMELFVENIPGIIQQAVQHEHEALASGVTQLPPPPRELHIVNPAQEDGKDE
jgi:hypothetical protein